MCSTTTPSSLLSNFRRSLPSEPRVLQPAARMWQRMSRVPPVALFHHAGHQLHSESSAERLECTRLETRSPGLSHVSPDPMPVRAVQSPATTAGSSLPTTVRSPLPQVPRETTYSAICSRQAVAYRPATVQSSTTRSTLHVWCYRVEEVDRTHSVQVHVSRLVYCLLTY